MIAVNNISHQEAKSYKLKERFNLDAYRLFGTPPFKRVPVIGAGSGSDVAAALANGAEHVDAVEIDPRLHDLGARCIPTIPTTTRASRCTSTTAGRICVTPTRPTT